MRERADRKRKDWQQKDTKRHGGLEDDDIDILKLQGLTKCISCREIIYIYVAECPECGVAQEQATTNA
ncbi:MAG: hypothetical protein GY751_26365 [Bacteroidetes bacterium]|jgi:uncharacterized protein YuzB (UPF0349 family)|nr:hypothetical protein [Bacteroidota bacterium]|tara:strand:+ start:350 stop:553 length:204 start_codon:yes stop_codon:yes gene_type:complete